jgi:hypothetical protein
MTVAARAIEDRLRAIEDPLGAYNLMACHPPAVDTGPTTIPAMLQTQVPPCVTWP